MNPRLKQCCLFFAVFLFVDAQAQHDKPDKRFVGLDTCFQRILKGCHAAGFAVAVVEKNKLVYSIGVGYKDSKYYPFTKDGWALNLNMRTKVNIPDFTQRFTDVALTKRNAIYAGLSQKVDGLPDPNIENSIMQNKTNGRSHSLHSRLSAMVGFPAPIL